MRRADLFKRAREPESVQFLQMTLPETLGANWLSAIKILL